MVPISRYQISWLIVWNIYTNLFSRNTIQLGHWTDRYITLINYREFSNKNLIRVDPIWLSSGNREGYVWLQFDNNVLTENFRAILRIFHNEWFTGVPKKGSSFPSDIQYGGQDAIIPKNDIWVILLWGLSYILLKYISGNCHLNSFPKTAKATYKSKHWTVYRLNGVCGQCFRPLSQVLRFRLTWSFIIRLRLTKYTCRIKFWRCLNLSFSFPYFQISYILFHLNIIPSNYLFKNWNQVRHSENHDMYLILILRMFYFHFYLC